MQALLMHILREAFRRKNLPYVLLLLFCLGFGIGAGIASMVYLLSEDTQSEQAIPKTPTFDELFGEPK